MSTDASLFDALITGNARKVMEELFPQKSELGPCDDCQERPGTHKIVSAGTDTLLCDVCVEDDRRQMKRLPRFRNRDERDAYEAGVRARGEI